MEAVIYKLTVVGHNNLFYVGSSIEFEKRMGQHITCVNNSNSINGNRKLYNTIRDNGGKFEAEILYEFQCATLEDQWIEEQRWIDKLKPTLNSNKAHRSEADKINYIKNYKPIYYKNWLSENSEYHKNYYNQNTKNKDNTYYEQHKADLQERVKCVCGCESSKENLKRHMRTNKHIKRMTGLNNSIEKQA